MRSIYRELKRLPFIYFVILPSMYVFFLLILNGLLIVYNECMRSIISIFKGLRIRLKRNVTLMARDLRDKA